MVLQQGRADYLQRDAGVFLCKARGGGEELTSMHAISIQSCDARSNTDVLKNPWGIGPDCPNGVDILGGAA